MRFRVETYQDKRILTGRDSPRNPTSSRAVELGDSVALWEATSSGGRKEQRDLH